MAWSYRFLVLAATFGLGANLSSAQAGEQPRPFKVEIVSNLVFMPGYVNGSGRLNTILDTGASDNILDPEIAQKLGLKPASTVRAEGIGKGEDETQHVILGVELAWGPAKEFGLKGQKIDTLPISYISSQTGHPVDSLFGGSLFQNFNVRVDYEQQEVTFTHAKLASPKGTVIPVQLNGGVPFVEATFETSKGERITGLFLIDSGTTGSLILNKNFLDAHPGIAAGHEYVKSPSVVAVGGAINLQLLRLTALDLGSFHFYAPVAAVPQHPAGALANTGVAGFIGGGILNRFTVDWDYTAKTMTLSPNRSYDGPFESDASGMKVIADGADWKTLRIIAVLAKGPAAEAGIQPGDVVDTVDGKPPPPLYELTKRLSHPGDAVTLGVLRNGKQLNFKFHLRRLV